MTFLMLLMVHRKCEFLLLSNIEYIIQFHISFGQIPYSCDVICNDSEFDVPVCENQYALDRRCEVSVGR